MTSTNSPSRRVAVVVAHPDDEVLWCGGLILECSHWKWHVNSVCRGSDPDRSPRFIESLKLLNADGEMPNLVLHLEVIDGNYDPDQRDGFAMPDQPYYAMWTYKSEGSERFDLPGNSLAILTGIASKSRAQEMITWVENQCQDLHSNNLLSIDLPPCLIPVIVPSDPDWRPRYAYYNEPHHYHNGGIWPFIGGFYVAALVAAEHLSKARETLAALTDAVKLTRDLRHTFGFNEWILPQGPVPKGQDWQTWSAAMYLYAEECVRTGRTPYFDR